MSGQRWILAGHVITPFDSWERGALAIEGERIVAAGRFEDVLERVPEREGWKLVDYKDAWMLPGMIDLHTHGALGADVMMATPEALATVAGVAADGGATGLLVTTRTASREALMAVARLLGSSGSSAGRTPVGAQLLGLHLEGPYVHPRRAGGQPVAWIRDPDREELGSLAEAASGHLRMVTLAPERPGGMEMARWLVEHGIVAALGHSEATYGQALEAIRNGVTQFTHAYNAMPPLHHREPGALMAGLLDERVTVHLIADGVHVHPAAILLAYRLKGPDRMALITDATGAGLPPGRHELAGRTLVVDERAVRLPDGTLAGSKLRMNQALRVCVEQAGIPLADAARMASTTPARVVGLGSRKGVLAPGYDADVTVLGRDFGVRAVMALGRFVGPDSSRAEAYREH